MGQFVHFQVCIVITNVNVVEESHVKSRSDDVLFILAEYHTITIVTLVKNIEDTLQIIETVFILL